MGASIHLRHIITNKLGRIGVNEIDTLFEHLKSIKHLQSNVYYEIKPNYLQIEYFAKSISTFLRENIILQWEDVLTIYSHDQALHDSYLILDSDINDNLNNTKEIDYNIDKIEISGDIEELNIFQEYLYEQKHESIKIPILKFEKKVKLKLHSLNSDFKFSGNNQRPFKVIEIGREQLQKSKSSTNIINMVFEDYELGGRLNSIIQELLSYPDYYDYKLDSIKLYYHNKLMVDAKLDLKTEQWDTYLVGDIWKLISNQEIVKRLEKIDYP